MPQRQPRVHPQKSTSSGGEGHGQSIITCVTRVTSLSPCLPITRRCRDDVDEDRVAKLRRTRQMLRLDIITAIWVLRNPHLLIEVGQISDSYFEPLNIYLNDAVCA